MTNPISVLLIIGAAVVGPIEQQPLRYPQDAIFSDCYVREYEKPGAHKSIGTHNPAYAAMIAKCKAEAYPEGEPARGWETLPQLCERAMREIGVKHPLIGDLSTGGFIGRAGGETVRCIPTPAGYRR